MNEKTIKPPYSTYKAFAGLIEELRSHEVLPGAIDRGYLSKRSGSEQSALIATLKWFNLADTVGRPTELLRDYVAADADSAEAMFRKMVVDSYGSITDGSFALDSATTNMLAEKFREYGIGGSTLTKSISFFLSATKDAGIKVSPHAKAPPAPPNGGSKRKAKAPSPLPHTPPPPTVDQATQGSRPKPPRDSMVAIPIPIFGGQDGVIYLPDHMTAKQWESVIKMTEFILQNYRETMAEEPMPNPKLEGDQ